MKIEFADIEQLQKKIQDNLIKKKIKITLLYNILYDIDNIIKYFIKNCKIKKHSQFIIDDNLEGEYLKFHNKILILKIILENDIKSFKIIKFENYTKGSKIIDTNIINLINFCFSYPELENKDQYELLLKNLSKLQNNLLYLSFVISKGVINEENLIFIISKMKNIVEDKYLSLIINNDNYPEENIKNIIKNGDEKNITKIKREIEDIKKLFLKLKNNCEDIENLYKIFEEWELNYSKLISQVQRTIMKQNNIIQIEKEIEKYNEILKNKRKEMTKEEEKFYKKYIDSLNDLLTNSINDIENSFKVIQENFKNIEEQLKNNLKIENKEEYFHFLDYINFEEKKTISDNLKLIEQLIYYSKIKNNLNKIKDNKEKIKSLMEIYKIIENEEDLKEIIDDFFNFILNIKDKNINKEIAQFESQYKSFLLFKIGFYLLDKNKIINILNDYSKRDIIITKNDLNWASKIMYMNLEPEFEIIIPDFSPKDILNLFELNYLNDSKREDLGFSVKKFIMKDTQKYTIKIKKIKEKDIKSYSDCLNHLINNYLEIYESKYKIDNSSWTLEKIEDYIRKYDISSQTKEYFKIITELLKEIKNIDNIKERIDYSLIYDDFFFLYDKNWYLNKNNKNENSLKYPSLCFYLIKNPICEEDFLRYYSQYKPKKDKFPIYFLLLRLFTHKSIIKCDESYDSNSILKLIKKELDEKISNYLEKSLPKDLGWIGLFTNDYFKKKNLNSLMEDISSFLYNFQLLNGINQNKVIENILQNKIIGFIFQETVEGKIEEYFNLKVFSNNSLNEDNDNFLFLIDANKIINKENEKKKKELESNFIKDVNKKQEELTYLIERMSNFYEEFKSEIIKAIENKKNELRIDNLKKGEQNKMQEMNNFTNNANSYNNYYEKLSKVDTLKSFHQFSKHLFSLKNNLTDYTIFSEKKKKKIGIIKLDSTLKGEIRIEIDKKSLKIDNKELDNNNFYYKLENLISKPIINVYINNKKTDKLSLSEILFHEISTEKRKKIEDSINSQLITIQNIKVSNINIDEPRLMFRDEEIFYYSGNNDFEKEDKFKLISQLLNSSIKFCQDLDKIKNQNQKILEFSDDKDILNLFEKTFNYKTSQFEKGNGDTKKINEQISRFRTFKKNASAVLNKFYQICDQYRKNFISCYPINLNRFVLPNLQRIVVIPKKISINLDNHKVESFVSISKNEIINFHSGKFTQIIGPIIPEFYYNKEYNFKIFSFIDKNVNLRIQFNENEENDIINSFRVLSFIPSLNPLQIFFKVPNITVSKPTQKKINFKLLINLEGNVENIYKIECEFYIQLIPLKIYISSSKCGLFFENDKLKLNIGSILELDTIDLKFEIPYFENYEIFRASYYITSLKDNTSRKPSLSFNKKEKKLLIEIGRYKENYNHLHFLIIMKISENVEIIFEINTIILKKEYIITFINLLDELKDTYYNCLLVNNSKLKPTLKITLVDEKEAKLELIKKMNINKCLIRGDEKRICIKRGTHDILIPEMKELKNEDDFIKFSLNIYNEEIEIVIKRKKNPLPRSSFSLDKEIKKKIEEIQKSKLQIKKKEEIIYKDKEISKILLFSNYKKKYEIIKDNEVEKSYDISSFIKIEGINEMNSLDINSDKYKIPNIEELKTLNDYIKFYQRITDLSNALPFLIKIRNFPKDNILNLLNNLFAFYDASKNNYNCILSKEIIHFIASFQEALDILKKSGVQISSEDINEEENIRKNRFIPKCIPYPNQYILRDKTKWNYESELEEYSKISKKINTKEKMIKKKNELQRARTLNSKYKGKKDNLISEKEIKSESLPISTDKEEKKKKNENSKKAIEIFEKQSTFIFEEKTNNLLNIKKAKEIQKINEIPVPETEAIHLEFTGGIDRIATNEEKQFLRDNKKGIRKAFKRMIESEIKEIFIPKCFPYDIPKNILNNKIIEKPEIKNLDKYSVLLTLKFMKSSIEFIQNYTDLGFVVAIDCSTLNEIENKLLFLLVSISFCKCLHYLEIPFSIIIFSDYQFQYIIKDFNENFSLSIMQRMYDCIIVDRFFTRIFDACYFIDNKIKFPDKIKNKVAIIFSNGIDINLNLGDKWKNNLKNKISYCFFFNSNNNLNNEDLDKLKDIWKNFEVKSNFPVIDFNFENIFMKFDLSKYENLLKKLEDKVIEKKKEIMSPNYHEYSYTNLEEIMEVTNDISIYYNLENKAYVKNEQKENHVENLFNSSLNIINSYEIKASDAIYDQNLKLFLNQFNQNLPNISQQIIDEIFPPNKPTLYVPSTKGNKLNISGLLNFFITHGQENKIWLEKKERLKRDYRISVIIDSSRSCFNKDSFYFSFNIINILLKIISLSMIPYFDLIIATDKKPEILCSGVESNILNNNLIIWNTLISLLYGNKNEEYNVNYCNLYDAIYLAFQIRAQQNAKKYICFVLTDGIFDESYKKELKNLCSFYENLQMNIFGIGIGLYPEAITEIFSKCLWSQDINFFIPSLISLIKNEKNFPSDFNLEFTFDKKSSALYDEIKGFFGKISLKPKHYCGNNDLYNYLDNCHVFIESLNEIMNEDLINEDLQIKNNPINSNINSMFKEGFFENLKILICCFWSKSIASDLERDEIDLIYLKKRFKDKKCLADVINYYGIKNENIIVVSDYENGIKQLCTGKYYATWIICGNGGGKLPEGGNPNLVGQFINCTIRYWKKGGSLVWWCDNYPFVFEFNLFMSKAYSEFPGEKLNKFKFGGNNKGATLMSAGDISKNPKQRFNNKRYFKLGNTDDSPENSKYSIPALGHSLVKIAIGTTVSYAQEIENDKALKNPEEVSPFIPFAYDDEGCITILFYISPLNSENGNIVIDGGFSKLFTELDTEGTAKYIQNIVGFTSLYHKRLEKTKNVNWMENFSLPSFEQRINYEEKYDGFIKNIITKEYDIIYMIDATGSMEEWIHACADRCINLSTELKDMHPNTDFYFGGIFYRDPVDSSEDKHDVFDLTNDINELKFNFGKIQSYGGGDGPEDWVGAYKKAINNINWKDGTKLIIHFADAPAHTKEFCGEENHEEENGKLQIILESCSKKNIKIISIPILVNAKKSFEECEKYYTKYNGFYKILNFDDSKSANISDLFSDFVKEAVQYAAPKNIDIWGSN